MSFFTRDFGKVKGLLKGIRRDPRKFGSALGSLSLNHIVFYRKRSSELHLVSQCDVLDDFGLYRGELRPFGFSLFLAELVEALMPTEDPSPQVFALIFEFLNSLKNVSPVDSRCAFFIKMLTLSGFKPHLDSCLLCQKKASQRSFFSHARGGLLCERCVASDRSADSVLPGVISSILYMEKSSWERSLRLSMMPQVRRQMERILASFLQFHLGRSLRTSRPIAQFLNFEPYLQQSVESDAAVV